jgi:O-antigen/teichoic acid export membrane protein
MGSKQLSFVTETTFLLYRHARNAVASRTGRSTIIYAGNFLIHIFIQFGYFLLMVRIFNVSGYGVFSSVTAITFFLSNFVGWGCERVLIQRVTVKHEAFPDYFGHSILSIFLTAPIVFIIAYYVVGSVAGSALEPFALASIILADTICLKFAFLSGSSYMAFDKTKHHVAISIGVMLVKISTLVVAHFTISNITLNEFAFWYFISNFSYAVFTIFLVSYELGRPRLRFFLSEWRLGLLYSLEYATLSGMRDLDKPIVLATLGAEASGYYAAAFRVVEAASTPIMGLLYATYTGYFKNASAQLSGGIGFGLRVLPYGLALSAAISLFLICAAGFLPLILGQQFFNSVLLVQILSIFPILRVANGIGSDILRAINLQGLRVIFMTASTMLVMPSCWIGIQLGGLKGAVVSVISINILIALFVWIVILRKSIQLAHLEKNYTKTLG